MAIVRAQASIKFVLFVGGSFDRVERDVRQSGSRKSRWQNGYWVTRVATVCGVVVVGVGIESPRLFQIKVMAFLAIGTILLSVCAIGMMIWQIEHRSRRLRQPLFWASLLLNLALIGAVTLVYYRGINLPRLERANEGFSPPAMPEGP